MLHIQSYTVFDDPQRRGVFGDTPNNKRATKSRSDFTHTKGKTGQRSTEGLPVQTWCVADDDDAAATHLNPHLLHESRSTTYVSIFFILFFLHLNILYYMYVFFFFALNTFNTVFERCTREKDVQKSVNI